MIYIDNIECSSYSGFVKDNVFGKLYEVKGMADLTLSSPYPIRGHSIGTTYCNRLTDCNYRSLIKCRLIQRGNRHSRAISHDVDYH